MKINNISNPVVPDLEKCTVQMRSITNKISPDKVEISHQSKTADTTGLELLKKVSLLTMALSLGAPFLVLGKAKQQKEIQNAEESKKIEETKKTAETKKTEESLQTREPQKAEEAKKTEETKKIENKFSLLEKPISTEEYKRLMEEIKSDCVQGEWRVKRPLYDVYKYDKTKIEPKYEGLIPYVGYRDFHEDINRYLSNREQFLLTKSQAEKLAKVLSYSLSKLDEEYGKYEGVVFRKGYFNPNVKQYYSSSIKPESAAKIEDGWLRYNPYSGYSIIKTKSGHKIYDFQKSHGSEYCESEAEVILSGKTNYRKIPPEELTPEDLKLKEKFASKFFDGAQDVLYNGKELCGENRESILKRISVYEECDDTK